MDVIVIAASVITTCIGAACLGMFRTVGSKLGGISEQVKANNDGTRYLLKDRITQSCRYWQGKGYIYPNEAECLQEMLKQYKILGGNSYVEHQVEKTLSMPMSPEGTKVGGSE